MSPKLVDSSVGSLLFADDLVILSETKEGLQNSMDNLGVFCDNWKLTLNIDKTKSMVIQQKSSHQNDSFISYKNNMLQNVTEYRFLGSLLKNNGNLNHSLEDLANKGRKVLFSMKAKTSSLRNIPIEVSNNLFDKLVRPVLTYNSEIWFMDSYISTFSASARADANNTQCDVLSLAEKYPFEKVHSKFCKSVLGLKKTASNIGARTDLGRFTLDAFIKSQTLMYYHRLNSDDVNPLVFESGHP